MSDVTDHTIVLALNSGSSSLKLALYLFCNGEVSKLASAAAEEIGGEAGKVWLRRGSRLLIDESRSCAGATEAAKYLITVLRDNSFPTPQIVGHRIVHGGPHMRKHQRITPEVLRQLEKAAVFAPLHLPPALHVLRQAMSDFPDAPHIACFDTAFHRTMPEYAARLPFANKFWKKGLRRYGFHGLSCESIVHTLGKDSRGAYGDRASRQWLQHHCCSEWRLNGNNHGAHSDGWSHNGNAQRRPRSWCASAFFASGTV